MRALGCKETAARRRRKLIIKPYQAWLWELGNGNIVSNDDHKVSKKVELLNAEASRVMKVPAVSSETGAEVAPTITGRRRWEPQRYGN